MIYVGTSGWNYSHWKGVFYPQGLSQTKWLEFYHQYFNCVEVNVTFYRLVQKKTFENWHKRTPQNFSFVIKGSRFITHIKKLADAKDSLNLFINNVKGLEEKLSLILWQLPPSFKKDTKRLVGFLKLLKKTKIRQVFEFRNETWFNQETYDLLKDYNFCLCIAHSNRFPCLKEATADFLYLRFHGGESLYSSNYSDKELKEWAGFAREFSAKGGKAGKNRDIFAFFNNDAQGFAIKNALRFTELLQ